MTDETRANAEILLQAANPGPSKVAASVPDWWPRRIEAIGQLAAWARGGPPPEWPMEVFFEISNVCDLKCAMCPTFSSLSPSRLYSIREQERGFIDTEKVLAKLEPMLHCALILHCFGYGEPSLHPGFADLLAHLQPYRLQVDFFTNGMHFDQSFCDLLVENRVHAVTVSFSGANRESYEAVYHGGRFDAVLAGLDRLDDAKQAANSRYPRVEINSLGFEHQVANLPAFVELMAAHGVDVIHLKALQTFDVTRELLGHRSVPRPWVEGALLEQAAERARALGVHLSCDQYWETRVADEQSWITARGDISETVALDELANCASAKVAGRPPPGHVSQLQVDASSLCETELSRAMDFAPYQGETPFYCFEPFKTIYVRRSGNIKPCCFADDSGPALGSLFNREAADIWQASPWRALRDGVITQRYPMRLCGACLRHGYGPRRHDLPNQLKSYAGWLADAWGQQLDSELDLPTRQLSNTEVVRRTQAAVDYLPWLNEVRRLIPFGVPEHLLQGNLDGTREGVLHGWLRSPEQADLRLSVAIFRDGAFWTRLRADMDRDDLREAGIGDGSFAFAVALDECSPGMTIEVYLAETDWLLGRVTLPSASPTEVGSEIKGACGDTSGSAFAEQRLTSTLDSARNVLSGPKQFQLSYDPGMHEREILRFFGQFTESRSPPTPNLDLAGHPLVIVLFSNRSGSNLLTEAMAATGLVQNAGECFNFSTVQDYCLGHGIQDLTGYLNHLTAKAASAQCFLGIKLSWDQLYFLTKVGVIGRYWRQPRFVWSLREDQLAQALSAIVAECTKCWSGAYPPATLNAVLASITPGDLAVRVQQISHAVSQLQSYFTLHGVTPALIEYQDLAQDPKGEAYRVLRELDLIPAGWRCRFDPNHIKVRKQRTPTMEAHLEKMRRQFRLW